MKKLDGRPRRTAGNAWEASQIVEQTTRPRQAECEPSRGEAERRERNSQPDQFVVDAVPDERSASNSHRIKLLVGVLHQRADTDAQHEAEQENPSAADNHW